MLTRLREHWQRGRRYASRGTWAIETYHRVMCNLSRHGNWPGRNRVIQLRLHRDNLPFFVRLGTSDFTVLDEIFTGSEYDQFVASIKGEIRQVVDLGANIGISARQWEKHFPGAQILAVEPDADNVRVLRLNAPDVKVIQACVAGSHRTVHLDRSRGAWGYMMTDAAIDTETVPAMTMNEILEQAGVAGPIDLLKCDIEGAEREVFADCLPWFSRVRNMVIETHLPYSPDDFLHDIAHSVDRFEVVREEKKPELVMLLAKV